MLEVPQQSPILSQIPIQRVAGIDRLQDIIVWSAPRKAHCDQGKEILESVPEMRVNVTTSQFVYFATDCRKNAEGIE